MNNRILIVEDHPAVCMALRILLASEGFDVVAETGDGAQALELLETLAPSTMILDLGIASMDGLTVISEVTAKRFPVKIIVSTGRLSTNLDVHCMQLGAHGFVDKKKDLSQLIHAVRAVRVGELYFPTLSPSQSNTSHWIN